MYSTRQIAFAALVFGIAIIGIVSFMPSEAVSGEGVRLLLACGSVLITLFVFLRGKDSAWQSHVSFRLALVVWWFLLCSEAFFPRSNNGLENAASGRFSLTAYTEALFWVFLAVCFVMIASKDWKWISRSLRNRSSLPMMLAGICIISVLWAPEKGFSLAWSFKLMLGVSVASYCTAQLQSLRDLRSFMIVTFAAFAFLTVAPVIEGTLDPSAAFGGTNFGREDVIEQGRFHSTAHPLVIGGRAGIMAVLALLFYSLERKRKMIAVALGCAVVIALAGAKTAFLAAVISFGVFFALRRKLLTGFAIITTAGAMAVLIVSMTSVGSYVRDYLHNGELNTISGRTDLWAAAWPEMMNHLALGHGYVSSKLVSMQVEIPWYAGHLHNAFLESLYNNGLPGFLILLGMNWLIARDLFMIYRYASRPEIRVLAIALLSLYAFLFLNGLTESYFGGQASAFYLLFLSLFGISGWLRAYSTVAIQQEQKRTAAIAPSTISPAFQ